MRTLLVCFFYALLPTAFPAAGFAATYRVPQDHPTVQAAIDAASSGDVVLVDAGRYAERLRLKPGVVLRSRGDDAVGEVGLRRAEATVIDGGGDEGREPGVTMAEGSVLDGFTVTNVGVYRDEVWQKHYDSQGEELGDDEGAADTEGAVPAVSIPAVNCVVHNSIVHHNGDVGISVVGNKDRPSSPVVTKNLAYRNLGGGIGIANFSQAIVRGNEANENLRAGIGCRNADPLIVDNRCIGNVRAGIGCREGARPVIRGNHCSRNRRAGIGIRMADTAPLVEANHCFENAMAGIGNRDGASPVIRGNQCYANQMAGIGCDGSKPLVVGNKCYDNQMAGIGMRGAAKAIVHQNQCIENKLVAIGVTQGSTADIRGNTLVRTGGVPPIIAVTDGSTATIHDNDIHGGGVAAVLVRGHAVISSNRFHGQGDKQGHAVWVWEGWTLTLSDNTFQNYRAALRAMKAQSVVVTNNRVAGHQGAGFLIENVANPAHVYGNVGVVSEPPDDKSPPLVQITGPEGIVRDNTVEQAKSELPE